jgi:DNA-binding transcriptional LysR family regulator
MKSTVTLWQLQAVRAVADSGSFSVAAAEPGTSQPNVSAAVSAFEKYIGQILFSRHPVTQTGACRALLPGIRLVLDDIEKLEETISLISMGPDTFTLAVPSTLNLAFGSVLKELWRREFPELHVEMLEGENDEMPHWLASGAVDVGIIIDPIDEDLLGRWYELYNDVYVGIVRIDHPLSSETVVHTAEFLDDRVGLSDSGCRTEVEAFCRAANPEFAPDLLVRDIAALLTLVRSGSIVTILPSTCETILPSGVTMINLDPRISRRLIAASHATLPPAKVQIFHELIRTFRNLELDEHILA